MLIVLWLLAACGGGPEETPEGAVAIPSAFQATLVCSQECANRGLCGTSPDRGRVVLLNREGPSVMPAEHDLAIAENSVVDIVDQRVERIVEVATTIEFDTTFFHLFVPERQDAGWAAAWCLVQGGP
jgi:hypothetical protein